MGRGTNGKNGPTRTGGLRPSKPTITMSSTSKSVSSGGSQNGVSKGNSEPGKQTPDRSQLNFPYDVRLGGYSSLQNAVTNGTPRIRRILMEECDYIMECRVCRNLFRSLPNFITHKLSYCKKLFDSTWSIGLSNLIQTSDISYNIEYEVDPALLLDENSCSSCPNNGRSVADLYSEIASKAEKRKTCGESPTPSADENSIRLQLKPLVDVPGGTVVLQQRVSGDPSNCDIKSPHMNSLQTARKDTAILGPDGKVMYTGTSKGIEQVIQRLSARMKSKIEDNQAQSTSASSVSCDICKTMFDSEKALRQHKRESLDCGKTWGFKCPINQSTIVSLKTPTEELFTSKHGPGSKQGSPIRRQSFKTPQSPNKTKRRFSMSPVKRIKMKYSKLDCSGQNTDGVAEIKNLSCSKCSSNFSTQHEMSMHLALCNGGVINCALSRDRGPPKEKIRISVRNDFNKPPKPSNYLPNGLITSKVNNSANKMPPLDEPHTTNLPNNIKEISRNMTDSTTSSTSSKVNGTPEVNNNGQYKNETAHSSPEVCGIDIGNEISSTKCQGSATATGPKLNGIISLNCDLSGAASSELASIVTSVSPVPLSRKIGNLSPDIVTAVSLRDSTKSRSTKPKTMKTGDTNLDHESTLLDRTRNHIPGKTFNLRRSVSSRVRASRRGLKNHQLHQSSSRITLLDRKTRKLRKSFTNGTKGDGKTN